MNVLRFMRDTAAWLNRFSDKYVQQAQEGTEQVSMLNTYVIAKFPTEDGVLVFDVVGIETLAGGTSMVINLATPPEAAPLSEADQAAEDQAATDGY